MKAKIQPITGQGQVRIGLLELPASATKPARSQKFARRLKSISGRLRCEK